MKNYYISFICLILFCSCNDFLDKAPDNRTDLDSPEVISELLVTAYPGASYTMICNAMSDDAGDKGPGAQGHYLSNEQSYFWKDVTDTNQDTPAAYWEACYAAIAAANHALEAIDDLGRTSEYSGQRGEALVARAYAHFMLVNIFAEHYDPATADKNLGIPYVTKPEKTVLGDYKRETVAEVYRLIRQDLEEGLPLINDRYTVPKYHFTKIAANAFASRFYLYIGEWGKVISHTTAILDNYDATMMRDWTGKYRRFSQNEFLQTYAASTETANLLITAAQSFEYEIRRGAFHRYGLTTAIKGNEIFRGDEKDKKANVLGLAWAYNIQKYSAGVDSYTMFKRLEFFKKDGINATIGFAFVMFPVFTLEEVLFNRIEAYAMDNKPDKALFDINTFLSRRVLAYQEGVTRKVTLAEIKEFYKNDQALKPYYDITTDQEALLKCAVDFRRLEFLFEGMRWFDIKRFHLEVAHSTYENPKVKDILTRDDLRRAVQIPGDAIVYGLLPNPR